MYVCICNPTTEEQIINCCKDDCTLEELVTILNICQNCKSCSKEINKIYDENSTLLIKVKNDK